MTFIEQLASEHKVEVVYQSIEGSEAFVVGRSIFLSPDLYPQRMNWKFCHELAHILLGHTKSKIHSQEQEHQADVLAVDLILPMEKFKPLVRKYGLDILKEEFPQASWEVIARRRIQFRPAVLTIFDNRRISHRSAPEGMNYPFRISDPEAKVAKLCYDERCHLTESWEPMTIEGYFVDENRGVERVILLTEIELF